MTYSQGIHLQSFLISGSMVMGRNYQEIVIALTGILVLHRPLPAGSRSRDSESMGASLLCAWYSYVQSLVSLKTRLSLQPAT